MSKPVMTFVFKVLQKVRVQSATEWTAPVHISHMSKPVMSFVLRATEWTASVHILTCPNL